MLHFCVKWENCQLEMTPHRRTIKLQAYTTQWLYRPSVKLLTLNRREVVDANEETPWVGTLEN